MPFPGVSQRFEPAIKERRKRAHTPAERRTSLDALDVVACRAQLSTKTRLHSGLSTTCPVLLTPGTHARLLRVLARVARTCVLLTTDSRPFVAHAHACISMARGRLRAMLRALHSINMTLNGPMHASSRWPPLSTAPPLGRRFDGHRPLGPASGQRGDWRSRWSSTDTRALGRTLPKWPLCSPRRRNRRGLVPNTLTRRRRTR